MIRINLTVCLQRESAPALQTLRLYMLTGLQLVYRSLRLSLLVAPF